MLKAIDSLNALRIIKIECEPEALGIKQRELLAFQKYSKLQKWLEALSLTPT